MKRYEKIATNDASRWAYAEMFFGEGAGTRRKLLSAEIDQKAISIPGYTAAFQKAYDKQNFADLAIKAAKERKHLDHVGFVNKNFRAIVRGDVRHISPVLIAAVVGGYYAHQLELDKAVLVELKMLKHRAEVKYKEYKASKNRPKTINLDMPYGG